VRSSQFKPHSQTLGLEKNKTENKSQAQYVCSGFGAGNDVSMKHTIFKEKSKNPRE
jgi:hypothetical protein